MGELSILSLPVNPDRVRGKIIRVLDVLNDSGKLTTREIAFRLGEPLNTIDITCRRGEKYQILKKKDWGYEITDWCIALLVYKRGLGMI